VAIRRSFLPVQKIAVVGKDVSGFFEVHFSSQFSAKTLQSYLNASGRWRGAAEGMDRPGVIRITWKRS
jgi:hypothetical protein